MKEKVVVTGAAGFIGSNLYKMLSKEGYSVVAIDNLSAGTLDNLPPRTPLEKIDVGDPKIGNYLSGVSTIFHLAAKNCLPDCAANPVETARVNVMGTANLLQAAIQNKVKHFVYADTSAEYEGTTQFPTPTTEVKPISVYACSKRGGALFCEAFHQLHGLNVTVVRYFNVYGPAQDWRRAVPPVMSAFTMKLLSGEAPVIYGTGKKRRDFIHVDDVNAFHLKLIREPNIHGKTYNLGSGEDFSVLEILALIEETLGTPREPIFHPALPTEAERTLADIHDTLATGWKPKTGIREGLAAFVDYMRKKKESGELAE